MREVRVIGFVGNPERFGYNDHIALMRRRGNGNVVYDLMNNTDTTIADDIMRCDKIYVIGDASEMPSEAQDIIGYATIMCKPILPLYNVTPEDIRLWTANFCINMAEGLMMLNEFNEDD